MQDHGPASFNYHDAFDRNIGWVTQAEQDILRTRRVAIAGLGGVGGVHLLTLARLGIGCFTIADFDEFAIANFNRQAGANIKTLGLWKIEVMASQAKEINPSIDLRLFPNGVTGDTIDAFLADADLFVDGIDFFALDIRRAVFARASEKGIPALTAAPLGMGVGLLAFLPGKMTFEQYFRLEGKPEREQYLRFLIGLAPKGLHQSYLVDPTRVDLAAKRGPSTVAACQLCAGQTAAVAVRLLLHRAGVRCAPFSSQFDAYTGKLATSRLVFGNNGPLQRLRLGAARRLLARLPRAKVSEPQSMRPVESVLSYGRWTPSGDNAQPWRFYIIDALSADIDFKGGDHGDIYDFRDHEPTTLSAGMLLETLRIAARYLGWKLSWRLTASTIIRIELEATVPDPGNKLFPFIPIRSVDRRPYQWRRLRPHEIEQLTEALGPDLIIDWHQDWSSRRRIARLGAAATAIRLRASGAYDVHRRVIDWKERDSPTGIPAGAVGVDRLTLALMRWTMQSWRRVSWLNTVLGTGAISMQLDQWPGWRSAAFFTIKQTPDSSKRGTVSNILVAGHHIQRFWLTAARLGLAMQPAYATLIFAHYGEHPGLFTDQPGLQARATRLAGRFRSVFHASADEFLFIGRIGEPIARRPRGRSVRRALDALMGETRPPDAVP